MMLLIHLEVVDGGFGPTDHWIVEETGNADVVVADGIILAGHYIGNDASVITSHGQVRDVGNIGEALAMRELMQYLRAAGDVPGCQKPLDGADRRCFRQKLDKWIHAALPIPAWAQGVPRPLMSGSPGEPGGNAGTMGSMGLMVPSGLNSMRARQVSRL